jgi:hypothetical protein
MTLKVYMWKFPTDFYSWIQNFILVTKLCSCLEENVYRDCEFTIKETRHKGDARKFVAYEFGWIPATIKYKAKRSKNEVFASKVAEFPIEEVERFNSEMDFSSVNSSCCKTLWLKSGVR